MRKNVIYVRSGRPDRMVFLYRGPDREQYLFTADFNRAVFDYFRYGKSIEQLRRDKGWRKNRKICKVVEERIPMVMKYLGEGGMRYAG